MARAGPPCDKMTPAPGGAPGACEMAATDREKWDERYRARAPAAEPSPSLVGLESFLPRSGHALDLAGGAGRNSLWLAGRGLDVTLVDVSPVALEIASDRAAAAGLAL